MCNVGHYKGHRTTLQKSWKTKEKKKHIHNNNNIIKL